MDPTTGGWTLRLRRESYPKRQALMRRLAKETFPAVPEGRRYSLKLRLYEERAPSKAWEPVHGAALDEPTAELWAMEPDGLLRTWTSSD